MKKQEEIKSLRDVGEEEVIKKITSHQEELMKLQFRHGAGQLEQSAQLNALRKSIARAKTVLAEKKAEQVNTKGEA